ncbi:MAG: hypothetical protein ACRDLT_13225 [Solirubrobacteraceae bacterium]
MNPSELTFRMAQARLAELHRRAADARRLTGPGSPRARLVPVTIRYADSLDDAALTKLAALDSAEPLTLPVLVADVEGELRAALSLVDSAVVADPFRPTVELVELLRTRADQLAGEPRTGLRARLGAPLRVARALRFELRGLSGGR